MMTTRGSMLMLLCAAALTSCDKVNVQSITEAPPGSARIMFANFAMNSPTVNFYSDAVKMTAVVSTTGTSESTSGTAYGSFGAGSYYTSVAPGSHTITAKITTTTDNGVAIASLPATLEANKYYTFYASGFYNTTTKTSDGFIVEDGFISTLDWNTYVRFVNASPNSQPMTLTVTYTDSLGVAHPIAVGAAVAYKSAGAYVQIPYGAYNLAVRATGASTDAITRTAVTYFPGRVYTVTARGDMTVTSTTATNRPYLDNTANR